MGCSVRRDEMLKDEISAGASINLELFGSVPSEPKEFISTAGAFANTCGGKIVFGVNRDGSVPGIDTEPLDEIRASLIRSFGPQFPFKAYYSQIDGKKVLVIDVSTAPVRPIGHFSGFIRSRDTNIIPTEATLTDLRQETSAAPDSIMSAPPFGYYDHESVNCKRIRGTSVTDEKTFAGSVSSLIDSAVAFILDHINITHSADGDEFEVPLESIREIVMNAVQHRSYNHKEPVTVTVGDDRIDVISPGMVPFGFTAGDILSGVKCRRNRMIPTGREGIGLSKAFDLCVGKGLRCPEIAQEYESVRVTLFRISAPDDCKEEGVLDYFRVNPRATISDTSEHFGVSVAVMRNIIESLRGKGVLTRTGSKKFGEWTVSP